MACTTFVPLACVGLFLGGLAALIVAAGPLNPPAGAVASTYKTLTEVEPRIAINATNTPGTASATFRINAPGSYYLTGNTAGAFNKHGIEVSADNVTIDLCGFNLSGGGGTSDGIATSSGSSANPANVVILNGTVSGWAGDGIDLSTVFSPSCRIQGVHATGNGGVGIKTGNGYMLERCSARVNGGGGINVGNQGILKLCETLSNSTAGTVAGQGSNISDCFSGFNLGAVDAMRTGGLCTVTNCTINSSQGNGLVTGSVSTITGCTINGANLAGITAGNGSTISHCSVNFAQTFNIIAATGCTVSDCTVQFANQGGIQVSQQCVVRNNLCSQNANGSGTGPNILATGADNRIEGNNCTSAGRGIKVDAAGNFLSRNTCSGNSSNYELVAGNVALIVSGATSGAILGSSGGVAPGSTDPNANFSY
ncbi:MAG: right-handed parallel beta-helix repeat-containing protein [Planctomycetota bacterium]